MRKVRNFFTGRLFPTLLLLLLFAAAFAFFALRLPVALAPFAAAERLFSFGVGVWVANEDNLSENKTAKLLLLLLLPYTGAVLCLCMKKRRTGDAALPIETTADSAEYFSEGADAFVRLLDDLKGAQTSIYLEFYIIAQGVLWQSVLAVLKEKAKAGVDVRVIYDDFGCALTMPRRYPKTLEKAGIRCRVFRPVRLSRRASLRDHRKIAVIDGYVAYTGGINLADEYAGKQIRFGHWKDAAVRVTGCAAKAFEGLFLQSFGSAAAQGAEGGKIPCTVFADRADESPRTGIGTVVSLVRGAKQRLWLFTPYLSPDGELLYALKAAARDGADVRIAVPHLPDKKSVFLLTRHYARKLEEFGVRVREYEAGFLHAKNIVSDGDAAVSSYNLDFRSMRLQAECGVVVHDKTFADAVAADFEAVWDLSVPTPPATRRERFLVSFLKLFAPLA